MKQRSILHALTLIAGLIPSLAMAQTRELVIAAWGDPYEAAWRRALIPEFEKQNNAKVIWVQGFSSQTLAKLRAQKDNPQIDVAMMDDGPFRAAAAGDLFEKLDRSKIPNATDLYDVAFERGDFGIAFGLTGFGLYYSPKVFEKNKWAPPTSWLDLFRPEFKGKVLVHNIANAIGLNLLLALNKIDGGDENNMERGFQKMKELAPAVITFDRFGETPTLIQQDAVAIGTWSIDRVVNFRDTTTGSDLQFVFPKEGAWGWKEDVGIVKGRHNQDLAYKWIDLILSKQQQELTAEYVGFGPLSKSAQLKPNIAKNVVYGDNITKLNIPNWELVNEKRPEWTERWNKEIERR